MCDGLFLRVSFAVAAFDNFLELTLEIITRSTRFRQLSETGKRIVDVRQPLNSSRLLRVSISTVAHIGSSAQLIAKGQMVVYRALLRDMGTVRRWSR